MAGVAAVVAVAVVAGTVGSAPAMAETPPPMQPTSVAVTLPTLIGESVRTLEAEPEGRPARDAQTVQWQVPESQERDPVIVPKRYQWVWNGDGTGHLVATTTAAYSVESGKIVAPAGAAPAPGTAVPDPRWANGGGTFTQAPPRSGAEALAAYLRAHVPLPTSPDALAYWGALRMLMTEWTLTPQQNAAALQLLEKTGDLSVLGTVTDRMGRAGIAVSIASTVRPQFTVTLVLDATTRRIIAADTVYVGGVNGIDLAPGSVVEYAAWLTP
ncbi:hypothetical protein [Microbacterium sp.]|uniref:hypothetical protein n=1 Tax=Microbacterium sp. TaxID=51671 RepID=UPI003A9320AC